MWKSVIILSVTSLAAVDCHNKQCRFSHDRTALGDLIEVIRGTKKTIDVCVFTISCRDLAQELVNLHENGVVVRIITDGESINAMGSQIGTFRSAGIQVRHNRSSFFMHHKFVLIDNAVVINGSFNWTMQAVTGNHENLLITNNMNICNPYEEEFTKLWALYAPINLTN
ncbi:PREDICTED: mitochondrial cardiolipin hydrolase-like isoform X2 [Priapulus caudatus]|uniref:Mitochondrial cardiolipin hydrolase n=1 Tax=Priapulus caudatus TaxID=37621 RepID=A0ABM1DNU9_PRICU|nr:PREDICTED: mitochondrial cardiolipin hydrolase-like isoform X2 [Priapulus caudatus]